jgi:hypothetical protein
MMEFHHFEWLARMQEMRLFLCRKVCGQARREALRGYRSVGHTVEREIPRLRSRDDKEGHWISSEASHAQSTLSAGAPLYGGIHGRHDRARSVRDQNAGLTAASWHKTSHVGCEGEQRSVPRIRSRTDTKLLRPPANAHAAATRFSLL